MNCYRDSCDLFKYNKSINKSKLKNIPDYDILKTTLLKVRQQFENNLLLLGSLFKANHLYTKVFFVCLYFNNYMQQIRANVYFLFR